MSTKRLRTEEGSRHEAFGIVEWSLLAGTAVTWGASSALIAEALESASPALVTSLRLGLGAGTLALLSRSRTPIDRSDRIQLFVLSLLWMAIPFTLFPIAQQWINSATAGMLNGAMPIFAALTATLLLRRLPGKVQLVGLFIGFAGVIAISIGARDQTSSSMVGVVLIVVATVCYGISINLAVPLQQRYGSLPVLRRALTYAVVMTLPILAVSDITLDLHRDGILAILVLGVVGTGLAFVAMSTLAGRTGGTRAAATVYVIPVVALVIGVVFRNDEVRPAAIGGIALVLIGALLMSRREQSV